jgi:hypothetical protein
MKNILEMSIDELKSNIKEDERLLNIAKDRYPEDVDYYTNEIAKYTAQLSDLEGKKISKTFSPYPSAEDYPSNTSTAIPDSESVRTPVDYANYMFRVTGNYPKDNAELENWKKDYANTVINKSNVPLSFIAKQIGLQGENQRFSDIVNKPEFQQFLKDMQNKQLETERQQIIDDKYKDAKWYEYPGYFLSELMYPAGIEAVKTGKNYTLGNAATETGINVAESVPWGAPLKAGALASKFGSWASERLLQNVPNIVKKAGTYAAKVPTIPFKAMEFAGKAPLVLGSVLTNSAVPIGREIYNVAEFDKPISDAAIDAGIGTAVNLGTPLFVEGALRGLTRATKNNVVGDVLTRLSNAIYRKKNTEEVLAKKANLYKKANIDNDLNLTRKIPDTYTENEKNILNNMFMQGDDYLKDKIAAESGIVTAKDYRNVLEYFENMGNEEGAKWARRMESLTPDEVLNNTKFKINKSKNDYITETDFKPDDFSESVLYTGPRYSNYNPKTKKLTQIARDQLKNKGSKNIMDLAEVPKYVKQGEIAQDLYELLSTYGINKLGKGDYAKRIVPVSEDFQKKYINPETRNEPKNIINETPDETNKRWSKGFATFDEQKTPEYQTWLAENIKRLAD